MSDSAATWAATVNEWQASGTADEDFAAERGVRVGALRYWARRIRRERGEALNRALAPALAKESDGSGRVEFGRVRVRGTQPSSRRAADDARAEASVAIVLEDIEIRVRDGADPRTVRAVVDAVRAVRRGRR